MNIAIISSMNKKYYDHCGERMVNTLCENWNFPVYIYNEDEFTLPYNVTHMGWNLGLEFNSFIDRWKKKPRIVQFAKKAFSIIHAMDNIECDRLVWLDADTEVLQPIPEKLWHDIAASKYLSSHFDVWHDKDGKHWHSCETGFFILNKTHKGFSDFKNTYKDIYYNDKMESIRRFYDGEVYGRTIDIVSQQYDVLNLSPKICKTPISRSVLAPYISHSKSKSSKNKIKN